MDPINVVKNSIRKKVAGSLKTNMPTKTVPTAPMPVQTAYAVPMGRVCVAFTKSIILIAKAIKKPIYHKYISLPVDSFALPKQKANATSNMPAIINIIQFISNNFKYKNRRINWYQKKTS
tara:strand:+ start:43812 stop:44171 length:360 start_codon:yes stop_codon:yes gene_type:complete